MGFITAAGDFCDLTTFELGNAELVTIDAENVLTEYGDPHIRKCALALLTEWNELPRNLHLAIATNNHDSGYVNELEAQLPYDIPVLSGVQYANKKTSPEMFHAAAAVFDVSPKKAIHIDDQLLSFRGARMAQFMQGILVKPYGQSDHRGVKAGRTLDTPVRLGWLAKQSVVGSVTTLVTGGIDG